MTQPSILLKNPAAELYEILNNAASQPKEMAISQVLRSALNLNANPIRERDILINGWAKLYYLLTECKNSLNSDKFDEAECEHYEVVFDEILVSVERWQKKYYDSQSKQSKQGQALWNDVGHLSNEKWNNLLALRVYAKSLENRRIVVSDDQIKRIIDAIKFAISELIKLEDKDIDEKMKEQIIDKLESIIEDIESDKFSSTEEIKNKISVMTCDLINRIKKNNTIVFAAIGVKFLLGLLGTIDVIVNTPENLDKVNNFSAQVTEQVIEAVLEDSSESFPEQNFPKQLKSAPEK
jgi:hypothetical protein